MNKSKIILASVGGVTLVVSLVLAYLIWSAVSEKGERLEELDGAVQSANGLSKLPVYPGPEAIKAYEENAAAYETWREESRKVAAIGDVAFEPTTPPALKAFLVEDARRLSSLPGGVDGVIVKPEFPFGFREYVLDGKLPAQEDLAKLQREWFDMATVVEALSKSGVIEITDLSLAAPAPAATESPKDARRAKKGAKPQPKAEAANEGEGLAVTRMRVEFRTKPQGLVAAANAFMSARRFIVVDDFTFAHERDEIAEKLGGADKPAGEQQSGRGRRGRRARQEEAEEESADTSALTGTVTDPQTAPAYKVAMSVSVYDFGTGSLEKAAEPEAAPAAEQPAAAETEPAPAAAEPAAVEQPAESEKTAEAENTEEQQ